MLTPPPVFRSPALGEKLRVLDLVSLRGAVAGRAERFVADKCRYFETASGVEHRVVVPGAEAGEDRWSESRVHAVASPRLPGAAGARVLIDRARVWIIAAEFQPHVIEVGDPWLAAWIGRGIAEARPARIVAVAHGDAAREWARRAAGVCGGGVALGGRVGAFAARLATVYSKNLYARMDALVAPTPGLAAAWRARGLRQARCVAPGVDTDRFYPRAADEVAAVRAEWDVPADARVLLYAGRLGREKHLERLVDVFRDLRLAHPRQRLRLVVLGDGEAREQVEGWAAVSGGRIRWRARPRSDAALAAAYAAADVFVHPGRGEGFGLSLAEAQACGLPVVVAREGGGAGGAEAALLPLAGNALVDAADGAAWVAAIREALAAGCSPAARTARHGAAKARFAWWHTYERMLGLYRELAGLPDANRVTGLVRPIGRWG